MRTIKVILIYFAIVIERILLIPFANIRPSTIVGVLSNEFEQKRLTKRVFLAMFLFFLYITWFWTIVIFSAFSLTFYIMNKFKK